MEKGDEDESVDIKKWMLDDFGLVEKEERLRFGEGGGDWQIFIKIGWKDFIFWSRIIWW